MNKYERHEELCKILNDTYVRKNTAYGDSFGKSIDELGTIAGLTRMLDKWSRIRALLVGGVENKVMDETVLDTLMDLANYSIMMIIELERISENDRETNGC